MYVDIRVYKQFDADLFALWDAGYPVTKMIKNAVTAYAHGEPCSFLIDEIIPFSPQNKNSVHSRVNFPDSDQNLIYMLRHIHKRYRNAFCKAVLRNALIQQNITAFFTDPSLYQLQNANIQTKGNYSIQNAVPLSSIREVKAFTFDGQTFVRDTGQAVGNISPVPLGMAPVVSQSYAGSKNKAFTKKRSRTTQAQIPSSYAMPTYPAQAPVSPFLQGAAVGGVNAVPYAVPQYGYQANNPPVQSIQQNVQPVVQPVQAPEQPAPVQQSFNAVPPANAVSNPAHQAGTASFNTDALPNAQNLSEVQDTEPNDIMSSAPPVSDDVPPASDEKAAEFMKIFDNL